MISKGEKVSYSVLVGNDASDVMACIQNIQLCITDAAPLDATITGQFFFLDRSPQPPTCSMTVHFMMIACIRQASPRSKGPCEDG